MYACSRESSAAASSAAACSRVSAWDGRPSRPCGVSTSAETFRRTRFRPSAVTQGPGEAVVRLLQRWRGVGDRHLRQGGADVLDGQVAQRDPPGHREDRAERVPVDLDGLGGPAGQALGQPVGNRHIHRVARSGPDARVQLRMQRLELVLDFGPGLAAELLADPLPIRGVAERDHPAPAAGTGLVVRAVPAVAPVVEVDSVFAVAPAFRLSHTGILRLGSHNGSQAEPTRFASRL
jgi:hypothetical protein